MEEMLPLALYLCITIRVHVYTQALGSEHMPTPVCTLGVVFVMLHWCDVKSILLGGDCMYFLMCFLYRLFECIFKDSHHFVPDCWPMIRMQTLHQMT